MTDNRTPWLREKLAKCGVEFTTDDYDHILTTNWWAGNIYAKYLEDTSDSYMDEDYPILKLRIKRVTPEQAIAATLGRIDEPDGGLLADVLAPVRVDEKERRAFEHGRAHERFAQQIFKEATS